MSTPRFLLAIDCATLPASAACVSDNGVRAELVHDDQRRSDAWIGSAVAQCLAAAERPLEELDGLAVSVGPGTFTGIRVGIATALGLAAPGGLPVAGINTLEALADIGLRRAARVVACIDARRDQVYAAIYEGPDDAATRLPKPTWGPAVCSPDEVTAVLAGRQASRAGDAPGSSKGDGVLAIGSGAPLLAARHDLEVDNSAMPLAAAIGRLALGAWPPDLPEPTDWRPAEPLYLRPPDAKPPRNPLLAASD